METIIAILILVTGATHMKNGEQTGVWLEEFALPYMQFQKEGYAITVATINGGKVPIDPRSLEAQKPEWKEAINALENATPLKKIDVNRYAAVYMPGGHGTMFDLAEDKQVKTTLAAFAEAQKVVSAVCHGPAALVDVKLKDGTYLVEGKKVTSFTNDEEKAAGFTEKMPFLLESKLKEQGASFVAQPNWSNHVIVDGNLITGQNPQSSEALAKAIIKKIKTK
ncbi:MAG: type 1 glutamine amidotransferase domain-containing protein [Epsilonproteobacteria bacterium]|nr:type 1 glutamine amidotransferase domain-containing protein [Campylobacterota bacterium]